MKKSKIGHYVSFVYLVLLILMLGIVLYSWQLLKLVYRSSGNAGMDDDSVLIEAWMKYDVATVFDSMSLGILSLFVLFVFLIPLGLLIYWLVKFCRIDIVYDEETKGIQINGKRCHMPKMDLEILLMFVNEKKHRLTREKIKQALWPNSVTADRNLDVHLCLLRKELSDFPCYHLDTTGQGEYELKYEPFKRICTFEQFRLGCHWQKGNANKSIWRKISISARYKTRGCLNFVRFKLMDCAGGYFTAFDRSVSDDLRNRSYKNE